MANWFTRTVSPTAIKNEYRQELLAAARNVRTAEQGEAFLDDVFRYEDKFTGPKTPAAKELNKKFDFASKDGADADLRNSIKAAVYNSLPSSEAAELALKNSRYRGDGEAEEALQNKIRNNPKSLDVLRANLTPDNASSLSPDLAQTLVGSAGNDTKKVAQTLISVYEEVQKQPDRSLARRDLRNAYATLHNAAVTLHPELKPTRQTEPAAPAKNIIAGDDLGLSVAAKERAMVAAANDMPKPPVPVAKHESTPPVAKHAEPVKPVVEKHEPKPVAAEKPVAKPVEPKASLEDKLEKLSNKKGLLLERGEVKNSKD